jgi:hypothetical protein
MSQYLQNSIDFVYQVCFQFPISALTIPRQLPSPQLLENVGMATTKKGTGSVSDPIYELCQSVESVSATLAKDPTIAPGDAWKSLYGHRVGRESGTESASTSGAEGASKNGDALARAAKCGKWGPTRPSDFFLQVSPSYHWNRAGKKDVN